MWRGGGIYGLKVWAVEEDKKLVLIAPISDQNDATDEALGISL